MLGFPEGIDSLHSLIMHVSHFPGEEKKLIGALLKDSNAFERLIKTLDNADELLWKFPTHGKEILEIIAQPQQINRLVEDWTDVYFLLQISKPYKRDMLTKMVKEPAHFQYIFKNIIILEMVLERCPGHAKDLAQVLLKHPNQFERLMDSWSDFKKLTEIFLDEKVNFLKLVLENNDLFRRLIENNYILKKTMKIFPNNHWIIEFLIKNQEEFKRLFKNNSDLNTIAKTLNEAGKKKLLAKILQNSETFKSVFADHWDICATLKKIPEFFPAILNHIFANPDEFIRLISNEYALADLLEVSGDYQDQICNFVITQGEIFREIFNSITNLTLILEKYETCGEFFLDFLFRNSEEFKRLCPNTYAIEWLCELEEWKAKIENLFLKNPSRLEEVMLIYEDLFVIAELFSAKILNQIPLQKYIDLKYCYTQLPNYPKAARALMPFFIENPALFKGYVRDVETWEKVKEYINFRDLQKLKLFIDAEKDLISHNSLTDDLKSVYSKITAYFQEEKRKLSEAITYTMVIAEGRKNEGSGFDILPNEIIEKIFYFATELNQGRQRELYSQICDKLDQKNRFFANQSNPLKRKDPGGKEELQEPPCKKM